MYPRFPAPSVCRVNKMVLLSEATYLSFGGHAERLAERKGQDYTSCLQVREAAGQGERAHADAGLTDPVTPSCKLNVTEILSGSRA